MLHNQLHERSNAERIRHHSPVFSTYALFLKDHDFADCWSVQHRADPIDVSWCFRVNCGKRLSTTSSGITDHTTCIPATASQIEQSTTAVALTWPIEEDGALENQASLAKQTHDPYPQAHWGQRRVVFVDHRQDTSSNPQRHVSELDEELDYHYRSPHRSCCPNRQ